MSYRKERCRQGLAHSRHDSGLRSNGKQNWFRVKQVAQRLLVERKVDVDVDEWANRSVGRLNNPMVDLIGMVILAGSKV